MKHATQELGTLWNWSKSIGIKDTRLDWGISVCPAGSYSWSSTGSSRLYIYSVILEFFSRQNIYPYILIWRTFALAWDHSVYLHGRPDLYPPTSFTVRCLFDRSTALPGSILSFKVRGKPLVEPLYASRGVRKLLARCNVHKKDCKWFLALEC